LSGPVGMMFGVEASGLQPEETITLSITGPEGYAAASEVTADSEGALVLFWDSSDRVEGVYQILAVGDEGSSAQGSWAVSPRVICGAWEGFDSTTLGSEWSWLGEHEGHWSLEDEPGALRIQTQSGTITGSANDQANLLLRDAPTGNYRVTTQVEFHADQDFQHAGLYLYEDEDHYVRLTRAQSTQGVGQGIYFGVEAGESYTGTALADTAAVVFLKLGRRDDTFNASYSTDGVLWHLVGQQELPGFRPSQVGISAANGDAPYATEIPADFEWLRIDQLCSQITLPSVVKDYVLQGRLIINEVMPQPASGECEWVELLNVGLGPRDISGYEVTDEDGNVYSIPVDLPEVPDGGFVLVYFDGLGAASNDYDFSDNLAVLHASASVVDIFEDDADQVAVYSGSSHSSDTIVAFMAYGGSPGDDAANAEAVRMWGRYWFAYREPGMTDESGEAEFDFDGYSLGLGPGTTFGLPGRWATYAPGDTTPGAANEVAAVPWYDPPDGSAVDAGTLHMTWQALPFAQAYDFQLADSYNFESPLVSERLLDPWWNAGESFEEGMYYWRVRVVGSAGRTGRWLGPLSLEACDLSTTGSPGLHCLGTLSALQRLQQRKDTRLLCLDGDHRTGVDDPWDTPHPTDSVRIHGRNNCCRACMAMINHYYGGNISQDYLSYIVYENWGNSLRWGSSGDASVGNPALDLGHDSPSGPGSTELAAWAWGVSLESVEVFNGKPSFSWISDRIDQGRPMVRFAGSHCVVIAGDLELSDGTKWVYHVDPAGPAPGAYEGIWVQYDTDAYTVSTLTVPPASGVSPRGDDSSIHSDSDGDGIMNFDEVNRFYTDPNNPDTDGDGIEDKVEITAYTFDADGRWCHSAAHANWDNDERRMERDPDSDNDGFLDGCEDSNHNGQYDRGLFETSNFNDEDSTDCPQLSVMPDSVDFGWTADTVEFTVLNTGGGGLQWSVETPPDWLEIEYQTNVTGPGYSDRVVLHADRSQLPEGETSVTLDVSTVFDQEVEEVLVRIFEDRTDPVITSVTHGTPKEINASGCPVPSVLWLTADASDPGEPDSSSGLDYVQAIASSVSTGSSYAFQLEEFEWFWSGGFGPLPADSYECIIEAVDMAGNHVYSYDVGRVEVVECGAPQLSTPVYNPSQIRAAWCHDCTLTVRVSAMDDAELCEVVLNHTVAGGDGSYRSLEMDYLGGEEYELVIGPFCSTGTVDFYVTATDCAGNTVQSVEQSVEVLECLGPVVTGVGQSTDEVYLRPCEPNQITLYAESITDPAGVRGSVWLRQAGEAAWSSPITLEKVAGSDRYEAVAGPFDEAGTWEWYFVTVNQDGGQTETAVQSFEVLECEAEAPTITDLTVSDQYLFLEPCTPNEVTFTVWVDSELELQPVSLHAYLEEPHTIHILYMSPGQTEGEYVSTMGPFSTIGTVHYKVIASDLLGQSDVAEGDVFIYNCQPDGPDIRGIQVSADTIYPSPCSPDHLDIQAQITDEQGMTITDPSLVYWKGNSTTTTPVDMTPAGGDVYQGTITGLTDPGVYSFYVSAGNDAGGQSYSEAWSFVVADCEVAGPDIDNVELRDNWISVPPCQPDSTAIRAQVTDPLELDIASVEVMYRPKLIAAGNWMSSPMILLQGTTYEGQLEDLTEGPWSYVVRAVNSEGAESYSAAGILLVRPCRVPGPSITARVSNDAIGVPPCRPSGLQAEAQVGDQYDIESVHVLFCLDGGEWLGKAMDDEGNGEYATMLGNFPQAGTVAWFVTARNVEGGWSASSIDTFQVYECHVPSVGMPSESADPIHVSSCDDSIIDIESEITDESSITGAWLAYFKAGAQRIQTEFAPMQNLSGTNRWRARVGPFESLGMYGYRVCAINDVGGAACSDLATFGVVGCQQPVIEQVSTSQTPVYVAPCLPFTLTVSAQVGADPKVDGTWLRYRQDAGRDGEWQTVTMQETGQERWYERTIGPLAVAGSLEYYVVARSEAGGWAWTATSSVLVQACSQPTIEDVTASPEMIHMPPGEPNTTLISAGVSDAAGISEVSLRYRFRTEEQWISVDMKEGATPTVYEVTLGPFDQGGYLDYRIEATNGMGMSSLSAFHTLVVQGKGFIPRP